MRSKAKLLEIGKVVDDARDAIENITLFLHSCA
jgi:hypothetical protein